MKMDETPISCMIGRVKYRYHWRIIALEKTIQNERGQVDQLILLMMVDLAVEPNFLIKLIELLIF